MTTQQIELHSDRIKKWLSGPSYAWSERSVAEDLGIDDGWLNSDMGSDSQVNAVLDLINEAMAAGVVAINAGGVAAVYGLRIQDEHGVIDGLVLYAELLGGARIATDTVWPSNMTDNVGVQAVHGVLHYVARELSDVLEQVRKAASALS